MGAQALAAAAITGRGLVTPLGSGVEASFERLVEGATATEPVKDPGLGVAGQHVGRVPENALKHTLHLRGIQRLDRVSVLAIAAADHALQEAGLGSSIHEDGGSARVAPERIGLCLGTSAGPSASSFEAAAAFASGGEAMLRRVAPLGAVKGGHASPTGEVARRFGLSGPSLTINAECASGNTVVAMGQLLLASGAVDAVLCVGVDATINSFNMAQANTVGALAAGACRPFSADRDGFVLSEGAAAVVLERLSGSDVDTVENYGWVRGVGMTTDVSHATAPKADGEPLSRAIREALQQSGLEAEEVDIVSAHGTGTVLNDHVELLALEEVFGKSFPFVPVHSVKSAIGHTLAAAGLVELIVLSQSLRQGVVPPTVGCDRPMTTKADLVRGQARNHEGRVGLSTSCGFGGNNTALILTSPDYEYVASERYAAKA